MNYILQLNKHFLDGIFREIPIIRVFTSHTSCTYVHHHVQHQGRATPHSVDQSSCRVWSRKAPTSPWCPDLTTLRWAAAAMWLSSQYCKNSDGALFTGLSLLNLVCSVSIFRPFLLLSQFKVQPFTEYLQPQSPQSPGLHNLSTACSN